MENEERILEYRGLFGPANGTAEEILNSILASLGSAKRIAEMAADCLSTIGPVSDAVIPTLIKNLHHDERASRAIRATLRGMGEVALQQLVAALPQSGIPLRYYVIKAIGEFGPAARSTADCLRPLLVSSDALDRFYAAGALTSIEGSRSELTLEIASAYSGVGYTEIEVDFATNCLADLGSDAADAVPIIILGLIALDDLSASGPTFVLGKIGHRSIPAIPALLHRACQRSSAPSDRGTDYASSALQAIAEDLRMRGELSEPLARAISGRVSDANLQSSCCGVADSTHAIRDLERWLEHADLSVRLGAIAGLGLFGPAAKPAWERLGKFLRSESPEERLQAALACGQIGGFEESYGRIAINALGQARVSAAMREWVQQVLSGRQA